jgi:hypothetical protein
MKSRICNEDDEGYDAEQCSDAMRNGVGDFFAKRKWRIERASHYRDDRKPLRRLWTTKIEANLTFELFEFLFQVL